MRKALCALLVMALLAVLAGPAGADDQADIKGLVAKVLKAMGGDKLTAAGAATWHAKGKITLGDAEIPCTLDWTVQGAAHERIEGDIEVNGATTNVVLIVNGRKAWFKAGENAQERDKDRTAEDRERAYLDWLTALLPLKDKSLHLSHLGESKVGDEEVVGLTVKSKGHRDVNLYFAKKTGRLLKSEMRVKSLDLAAEVNQEVLYEDYQEMGGVPRPTKVTYKRDEKNFLDLEVSNFKLEKTVEDSLFDKP